MIGLVRNLVIIIAVLTAIYAALSYLGRRRAADKVRGDYASAKTPLSEEAFLDAGIAKYQKSLRRKLIVGVYLIPLFFAGLLIYLAQYG